MAEVLIFQLQGSFEEENGKKKQPQQHMYKDTHYLIFNMFLKLSTSFITCFWTSLPFFFFFPIEQCKLMFLQRNTCICLYISSPQDTGDSKQSWLKVTKTTLTVKKRNVANVLPRETWRIDADKLFGCSPLSETFYHPPWTYQHRLPLQ